VVRDPSEQEMAALDIILRGGDDLRAVVGTFAGEDVAYVVRVTEEPGTGNVRVWPLAILLQDEHIPFVGGPREEQPDRVREQPRAGEGPPAAVR